MTNAMEEGRQDGGVVSRVYKLQEVKSKGGHRMRSVTVQIAGVEGTFLVDTGSDITGLSPRFLRKLGLLNKIEHFGEAAGIGSELVTVYGVKADVEVLGMPITRFLVFTGVANVDAKDGLIGMDVLAQAARVTFDLKEDKLVLEGKR